MGSEDDGRPVGGRLDHILAAAFAVEAAADECDIRESPKGAEFPDGIDQSHIGN